MQDKKIKLQTRGIEGIAKFLAIHKSKCKGTFDSLPDSKYVRGERKQCNCCGAIIQVIDLLNDKGTGWLPRSTDTDVTFRTDFPVVLTCENNHCHARIRTSPGKTVRCPACGLVQSAVVPVVHKGRKPDLHTKDEPTLYYRGSVTKNDVGKRTRSVAHA